VRVRDRGFALILVLLAAAAVFALTLQAAMMSRAATIESRVMRDRAEQERGARSAAVMVLTGLGTTVERFASQTGSTGIGSPSSGGGGGGGEEEPERPRIELPEMLKQMLGDKAEELEDAAEEAVGGSPETDGGGITGRVGSSRKRTKVTIKSLPTEPVTIRLVEGGPRYSVLVRDTSALLNVNAAERDQLQRYFIAKRIEPEVASALAGQIIDWRDEDDFAEPSGAERSVYRERGVICRNKPMSALEELKFLPAMTQEVFDLVRGDLTVAGDNRVHVGTAPREVLLSLPGMDDEAVLRVMEARRAGPINEKDFDRVLPLYARAAKEMLKTEVTGILRLRVQVEGDSRAVFEGLAVVEERGIRAVGMRPLL
jgi:type II secretory pathway component PulK